MKFLRNLFLFLTVGTFLSVFVFIYCAFKLHWAFACLAALQMVNAYVWAEITHTIFKKRSIPHPQSLAFEKEILNRYRF